ncbi:nucleotide exchange factor SIL1-like [Artemia franciscana]|uniref:nucleotide exchange factor SIL1-like n=1 Tax=Artemia franciscana TaxID=6661 RepID=UPI0032DAE81F
MQTKDDKRKVQILVDLEYYVHQIDNGQNFLKMGGLRDVIIPGLNSSFEEIRLNCAYVFGSCVQNNIKAQIMAYETNIIEILVRLIATDTVEVKNKCLYGLSVLSLQFPIAQKKLVELEALSEFALIVSQRDPILSKLQKKIIVFLYDLVLEPELTKQNLQYYQNQNETDNVEMYSEKLRQYNVSNIKGQLLANNWCDIVNTYLKRVYEESITTGEFDHDLVEKTLYFISLFSQNCRDHFTNSKIVIEQFRRSYDLLANDDDSGYFKKNPNLIPKI